MLIADREGWRGESGEEMIVEMKKYQRCENEY